jgi:tRNA(His) 5'-end guanylyltransferase
MVGNVLLENRMRALEAFSRLVVEPGGWLVMRLDGCGFHRFTEGRFHKPFDQRFRDLMAATARTLMEAFHALYAYAMSDEISLLMPSAADLYGRRLEKIVSVTAGLASAAFTNACGEAAHFDSRVWHGKTLSDVTDYFRWRQADAARNAMHSWCYWTLRAEGRSVEEATALLDGRGSRFQRRLLSEHAVDPDRLPAWQLRGVGLYWEPYEKLGVDPRDGKRVLAQRHRVRVDEELPTGRAYAELVRRIVRRDLSAAHAPRARRIPVRRPVARR